MYTEWVIPTTTKGVQDRVLSKSYITILSEEDKGRLCMEIEALLEEENKVWIDESSGIFQYPYKTTVISMTKLE
jgi:hypothetical protein